MRKLSACLLLAYAIVFCGCGLKEKTSFKEDRKVSVNNLQQIGGAMMKYSFDYDDLLAHSFNQLDIYLEPGCFIAPYDKKSTPAETVKELTPDNTSYSCIIPPNSSLPEGDGIFKIDYHLPIAFEKPWLLPEHAESIAILFADGSVKELRIKNVSKMSCEELLEELLAPLDIDPLLKTAMIEEARTEDDRR